MIPGTTQGRLDSFPSSQLTAGLKGTIDLQVTYHFLLTINPDCGLSSHLNLSVKLQAAVTILPDTEDSRVLWG